MNELAELKALLLGISARLDRIEAALGDSSTPYSTEPPKSPSPAEFTTRQHVVLQGVVRGWDNKKLAECMGISPITVKTHLKGAADKLGATKRGEVAVAASAMFGSTEPDQYRLASGGLPLEWAEQAEQLKRWTDDKYRALYTKPPT